MSESSKYIIGNESYTTSDISETEALGAALARTVIASDDPAKAFISLSGGLGAGKTAFVRGFVSVISPSSTVRSPTYTIVNEYSGGITPVFHFDLYRITDEDDLYSTGFYDYIGSGICIVEWSENAEYAMPTPRYHVHIDGDGDDERRINIKYIE